MWWDINIRPQHRRFLDALRQAITTVSAVDAIQLTVYIWIVALEQRFGSVVNRFEIRPPCNAPRAGKAPYNRKPAAQQQANQCNPPRPIHAHPQLRSQHHRPLGIKITVGVATTAILTRERTKLRRDALATDLPNTPLPHSNNKLYIAPRPCLLIWPVCIATLSGCPTIAMPLLLSLGRESTLQIFWAESIGLKTQFSRTPMPAW
jgi:hypothetical protein